MKNLKRILVALLLLAGMASRGRAAEIFKNDDLDLSIGGRIQELGENELVTDDPVRSHDRVYLWNVEDRIFTSGSFKDVKWNFEASFGGEDIANSTNGSFNLLDASADIALIPDMVTVKVGQFRPPSNLESAIYDGNMLFTEKSPNYNLFFNEGYDTGIALYGHLGQLDGQVGVVQGAPNLPQRYLPEIIAFPVPIFARVGFNDGISDDPFHAKDTGYAKPDKSQFAIHAMTYMAADSNAGHSDLYSQMGGGLSTFNNNDYYGNVLLSSKFNPYLSIQGSSNPVSQFYYQAGIDFQYRAPMGDTTFALRGQANIAHYDMTVNSPISGGATLGYLNGKPVAVGNQYSLNIGGGELVASVGDNPWILAGRLVVTIPDNGLTGSMGTPAVYSPIFVNSNPIWEITFPSISYHLNDNTKLVAETMFLLNAAESEDVDGNYVIAEMPGSSTAPRGNNIQAGFVPIGRMMFQFQY